MSISKAKGLIKFNTRGNEKLSARDDVIVTRVRVERLVARNFINLEPIKTVKTRFWFSNSVTHNCLVLQNKERLCISQ